MTRTTLLLSMLSAPLIAIAPGENARLRTTNRRTVTFGPGSLSIRPGGKIEIIGASALHVEGCVLDGCTVTYT